MESKQRIIDIIKNKIEKEYKEDVAIFAVYGSYAIGSYDDRSDVDFFFIPKTDRAYGLSYQFIIDNIGYDLFPISWERLARIAAFDEPLTAVVTDSKVIYSASEEDLERYESYRQGMLKMCTADNANAMLEKSLDYFKEAYMFLYNMKIQAEDLMDLRMESSKIISSIVTALAFANRTYYKKGMGANIKASFELQELPKDYQVLVGSIIAAKSSKEIVDLCEVLIKNTRQFLMEQLSLLAEREAYDKFFKGCYEELKSVINKIHRACEQRDEYTAFMVASYLHELISIFLTKVEEGIWYSDRNLYSEYSKAFKEFISVDLMELAANKKFPELKEAVIEFEAKFVKLLQRKHVSLCIYNSINEFEAAYTKI